MLAVGVAFLDSTLATPFYLAYQRAFGFSEFTLTQVYAVYVLGNMVALLFLGRLSDSLGRKPILMAGLLLACLSSLLFIFAAGIAWLFMARLTSGVAVGLVSSTGTAWLVDIDAERHTGYATLRAAGANLTGSAVGPLAGGVLHQHAFAPMQLAWVCYLAALFAVLVLLYRLPARRPAVAGWPDLRPRVAVPAQVRRHFVAPALTAFCVFAFIGYYLALLPSILHAVLAAGGSVLSGTIVFLLFMGALGSMLVVRRLPCERSMILGLMLLLPAVCAFYLAQQMGSLWLLVLSTLLAAAASGLGFAGSLRVVGQISPHDHRAAMASAYYAACFAGASIPVLGIGLATVLWGDSIASLLFTLLTCLLATAALAVRRQIARRVIRRSGGERRK
ncbi:MFS transporter [Achromobacter xylosoxidans]